MWSPVCYRVRPNPARKGKEAGSRHNTIEPRFAQSAVSSGDLLCNTHPVQCSTSQRSCSGHSSNADHSAHSCSGTLEEAPARRCGLRAVCGASIPIVHDAVSRHVRVKQVMVHAELLLWVNSSVAIQIAMQLPHFTQQARLTVGFVFVIDFDPDGAAVASPDQPCRSSCQAKVLHRWQRCRN